MFIERVVRSLEKRGVRYAIAGGFAVAIHGAVRGTVDIDIVLALSEKNFAAAEAALRDIGLRPRLPVTAREIFTFRAAYIKNRNLVAWNFVNPGDPTEAVDIIITEDLRKMKIRRVRAGSDTIPIVSIEDLIRMKKRSGRPQDLEDIKALKVLKKK